MSDHIGEPNEMSDTPISDSTPHNVAELGMLCRTLERLAAVRLDYIKQLETDIERLTQKVAELYAGAEEQKQRIKQLEDIIKRASSAFFSEGSDKETAVSMLTILEESR